MKIMFTGFCICILLGASAQKNRLLSVAFVNTASAHPFSKLESLATDVGSSRVDLQACKLEYSIVSPK